MSWWCDYVAGWIGGSAGIVCGHPADTVKTLQQASGNKRILETIRTLWRTEGTRGFFKGMLYPILSNGAINSIFFGVYGSVLPALTQADSRPGLGSVFLAGTCGGTVQLLIACPVELVKVRLQTQGVEKGVIARYRGPWHCLTSILSQSGLKGIYRGIVPHFFRDGPGFGIYMVLYVALLRICAGSRQDASAVDQFLAGGAAGTLCWLSVLPFDVMKSRMQSREGAHYRGMLHCAQHSLTMEGPTVFTRGALAMSLRAFPVNGVTFLVYELLLSLCNAKV